MNFKGGQTGAELETSEADPVTIVKSIRIDNSSFQLTVKKLNGKNYGEWAQIHQIGGPREQKNWLSHQRHETAHGCEPPTEMEI